MEVLTPFDLVQRFPERQTVAIVGNAPSLKDYRLGDFIDSHDIVVRFNEAAMAGHEEQVGRRTDILVANPYPEKRKRPLLDGGRATCVLIVNPPTRRGDKQVFERWVGDHPVLFTYTPDLVGVEESTHQRGLTTGTYAIQLLWRLLHPSRYFITGFTMFLEGAPGHYWSSSQPPGIRAHDMITEAAVFIRVLNAANVPVCVTPDIQWVSEQIQVPLLPRIRLIDGQSPQLNDEASR